MCFTAGASDRRNLPTVNTALLANINMFRPVGASVGKNPPSSWAISPYVCWQTPHVCWVNITSSVWDVGALPHPMARPGDSSGGTGRGLHRARFWGTIKHGGLSTYRRTPNDKTYKTGKSYYQLEDARHYFLGCYGVCLLLWTWTCLKMWETTNYWSSKKEADD